MSNACYIVAAQEMVAGLIIKDLGGRKAFTG